jgi:hypothetical protein
VNQKKQGKSQIRKKKTGKEATSQPLDFLLADGGRLLLLLEAAACQTRGRPK